MRSIRLALLSATVAAGVAAALTGCTLPDDAAPSNPASASAPATRPTTTATPSPKPSATPTPTPTYTDLPPAEGTDPEPSDEWTLQLVYDTCVGAPDADPANPIATYGALSESRIDQSGPGVWLVVVPVTRSIDGAETPAQQVCFIDGTPDAPNITVATSL